MFIGKGGKGVSGFYDIFYVFFFFYFIISSKLLKYTELKHYYLLCTYNRRQKILLLK